MRSLEHPEGTKLPALERNILKFRAFEMMLSLFYAEDLKRFLPHERYHAPHFVEEARSDSVAGRHAAPP